MHYGWMGMGMSGMVLFWVTVIVAVVLLVRWRSNANPDRQL